MRLPFSQAICRKLPVLTEEMDHRRISKMAPKLVEEKVYPCGTEFSLLRC